jgi:RHS repeat-associated protein
VAGIGTGTRGTVFFDGFVSHRDTYIGLDGGALPAPSKTDALFSDGFEAGNFSAWSSSTTDGGHLSVTTTAAIVGSKGMQAYINDNNALYVTDNNPFSETHYRARFYYDPNNIVMASANVFTLFDASNRSGTQQMSVEFGRTASDFQVRAGIRNDAGTWSYLSYTNLMDGPHAFEIEWKAATASGANNGYLTLWMDGTQLGSLTGIDNDAALIDSARWGGVSGIDSGTRGTVYFDGFVSQRESYVGLDGGALPAPSKTDNLFGDGFESNNLSAWSGSTTDGGHLSVTSAAAIFGSKGLNVYINDNNSLYVTDITPFEESHYRAHFHFKPNGITMATNDAHYIFYALDRSNTVQERIEFGKSSTGYQVRAGVLAGGSWTTTAWYAITNAAHYIETDWQASTASSSPYNGVFTLWIDGTQKATYTNLNTYNKTIDYAQLGGVSGIDTGTRGTEFMDAFDSHRSSYIGTSLTMAPVPESQGTLVLAVYHPESLPELVSQPKASTGGKMASLEAAVPGLRLPVIVKADQLVGLNIAYTYDPLGRLTGANYSDGSFFHYSYDAVGNRLSQTTQVGTVNYVYDDANRLASVGGVSYTWDANGNLLSDGASTYAYDHANRLKSLVQGNNTYSYAYNGLGNRVSQTLNAGTPTVYVLDQAVGLVQILSDGGYTYLYGNDRIAQQSTEDTEYFLTDALGSVRQLTNSEGEITLNRSYDPYGNVLASEGSGESVFAFTGEQMDSYSKLLFLRARYYSLSTGRFMSRDSWQGDTNQPMSYNAWLYGYANPMRYADPTGLITSGPEDTAATSTLNEIKLRFGISIVKDWGNFCYMSHCGWQDGNWNSPNEIDFVKNALNLMSTKMGGDSKVRYALDGIKVMKWKDSGLSWTQPTFLGPLFGERSWVPPYLGIVILTDPGLFSTKNKDWIEYIIIHEFGHAWDFRTGERLSIGMAVSIGTMVRSKTSCGITWDIGNSTELPPGYLKDPYAGTSKWEDWAEAFANTIDPYYTTAKGYQPLGPIRQKYVEDQIKALP